jgi:hypothetical protein
MDGANTPHSERTHLPIHRKTFASLMVAALVAALVGLLLPASPSGAAPQCRWEIEPDIDCPPMAPRPPRMQPPPMLPGEPGMTPMPDPRRTPPEQLCARVFVRDGIFIIETGQPNKLVYSLDVDASVCRQNGVVVNPAITSEVSRVVPGDSRITRITAPHTEFQRGVGTNSFAQREQVFFTACGDPFNAATCRNFLHYVEISADGQGTISATAQLLPYDGPIPI